jgi:hypothetical protein
MPSENQNLSSALLPSANAVLDVLQIGDKGQRLILAGQYELAVAAFSADMKSLDGATYQAVHTVTPMMKTLIDKKVVEDKYIGFEDVGRSIMDFMYYAADVYLTSANKHPRLG